ncbi:hypothetical protein, partial [Photobacterium alginatilyticum]
GGGGDTPGGGGDTPGGGGDTPGGGGDTPGGGGDTPGGGGDNPGGGDDNDPYAFCKEYPALCEDYGDCPTPEAPWLCDTRPECDPSNGDICLDCDPAVDGSCTDTDSIIAAINEVKFAVRDHNKTTFDVKNNTKAVADNTKKANNLLAEIRDLNKAGNDILDNKMVEMMTNLDGIRADIAKGSGDIVTAINSKGSADPDDFIRSDCEIADNQDRLMCLRLNGKLPDKGKDPFEDVLGEKSLKKLDDDIETLRDEITSLMDKFANDLGTVSLQEDGAVPVLSATFTKAGRTFRADNSVWIEQSGTIRSIVLAVAALVAFGIIILRRR